MSCTCPCQRYFVLIYFVSTLQGIVQNGWQGLTFIAMDLLEPFGMDYAAAVEVSPLKKDWADTVKSQNLNVCLLVLHLSLCNLLKPDVKSKMKM